jgi:hypothetical protein
MYRTNIIQSIYTRGWEIVYADLTVYMSNTAGVLLEAGTDYPSRTHEFAPGFFGGVRVAHLFSFLCCPIMCRYFLSSVLWCPLRFPHENVVLFVFTSSCLQEGSCLTYVVCLRIVVSYTYCVVIFCVVFFRVMYPVFAVSPDYSYFIVLSIFSNVYHWYSYTNIGLKSAHEWSKDYLNSIRVQ